MAKSGQRLTNVLKFSRRSCSARLNPGFVPISRDACERLMSPALATASLSSCMYLLVSTRLRSSLGADPPAKTCPGLVLSALTASTSLVGCVLPSASVTALPRTVSTVWTSLDQLGTPARLLSAIGCKSVRKPPLLFNCFAFALHSECCQASCRHCPFSSENASRQRLRPALRLENVHEVCDCPVGCTRRPLCQHA